MAGSVLETIDRFWVARVAGDEAAVKSFLASGATYEMVGAKAFAKSGAVGPVAAADAAEQLIKDFRFESSERLTAIVDGSRAATVSRMRVSFQGGGAVTSEACDVWEFDAAGKITSLKQFVDTDLVRRMMEGKV